MKKKLFVTVAYLLGLALIIGVVTYGINYHRDHANDGAKKYGTAKTACQILIRDRVSNKLNYSAKQTGSTSLTPLAKDVRASQCNYTQTNPNSDGTVSVASLTIQSPTNKATVATVKQAFLKAQKPLKVPTVHVYEATTFWDYKKGTFNLLKHNVWYVVTYGPSDPANRDISKTEDLLDLINASL